MEQPLTWLQTFYVVAGSVVAFAVFFVWLWIYAGCPWPIRLKPEPRRRDWESESEKDWEPALEPEPNVHVLGSDYPQRNGAFLRHLVTRSYTVPKDPEEYA